MNILFSEAKENRRAIYRISLRLPIYLVVNSNGATSRVEAMTVNLHHRGAEITTKVKMSEGTKVRLGLPFELCGLTRATTLGEIKWRRYTQGHYNYGVSFTEDLNWLFLLTKNSLPILQSNDDVSVAKSVLDSINDGVFSVDRQSRITFFNEAAEKLTGWQRHEVLGKKCHEVFKSSSCDSCVLSKSLTPDTPVINHHYLSITNAKGKKIQIHISTSALHGSDGEVSGWVHFFRNVCKASAASVCVQTLGSFCLTINGLPVYDRYWKGRCSKDLLKAIIALGGTKVPLERLTYLLWPDSDGDRAMNCLKMALSRLRKIGSDECLLPSNWLVVKHQRVSLLQSVCRVDALEFKRKMAETSTWDNEDVLQQTLSLYGDDFLPNDDRPWLNSFRDHLRKLFFQGVLHLASLENTEGDVICVFLDKAIQIDPLNENLYASLMRYYINIGFPAYALNIFRQAEENISLTTDLQPSSLLQDLATHARKTM